MKPSERPTKTPFCLVVSCAFLFSASPLLCGVESAAPIISLSSQDGPPTSQIFVSGQGFEPNVGVDVYFDTKDEALIVTNAVGEFKNARIHTPRTAYPGRHWITALERNNDKGAQQPFLVQTNWSQFHFTADGTRLNPYENVLNPDNAGRLALKWSYKTGGPVLSSPAVVDGVVYIGSNDFNVYALDARGGRKLWSFGTGNIVYFSSPAVAGGVVYISGTNAVYALDARTGRQIWSYSNGGPGTVAVVNGVVYFGSDDYSVYALDAHSGDKLWSFPTFYAVQSAPVVVNGVVYIGSLGYNMYALDAQTGAELWNYMIESYEESSPAVANGVVYFAGNGGPVFALNASTGKELWNYPARETSGSPAVSQDVVYIGSSAEYIYALDGQTGSKIWAYSPGLG